MPFIPYAGTGDADRGSPHEWDATYQETRIKLNANKNRQKEIKK